MMNHDRPILVTGAAGFVGAHLMERFGREGRAAVGVWRSHPLPDGIPGEQIDLEDGAAVREVVARVRPSVIIHCAALTQVAKCEADEPSARRAIVDATGFVAEGAAAVGARLIALSTDQVFDGERAPYGPDSEARPINVYGRLKLEAERRALAYEGAVVVRAALLYGPPTRDGRSFLQWMAQTLAEGKAIDLFEDEFRTPLLADDLCDVLLRLMVVERAPARLWHAGGLQRLSRLDMGRLVCEMLRLPAHLAVSVRSGQTDFAAPRPRDVSLDSSALWGYLGITPRKFADGLAHVFARWRPKQASTG